MTAHPAQLCYPCSNAWDCPMSSESFGCPRRHARYATIRSQTPPAITPTRERCDQEFSPTEDSEWLLYERADSCPNRPLYRSSRTVSDLSLLSPCAGIGAVLHRYSSKVAEKLDIGCDTRLAQFRRLACHLPDRLRVKPSFFVPRCARRTERLSNVDLSERWPRQYQNFSGNVAGQENAPASMASRATSRAADGVDLSTPVTN
jgi:hypothetical protein